VARESLGRREDSYWIWRRARSWWWAGALLGRRQWQVAGGRRGQSRAGDPRALRCKEKRSGIEHRIRPGGGYRLPLTLPLPRVHRRCEDLQRHRAGAVGGEEEVRATTGCSASRHDGLLRQARSRATRPP
jgi:hypothetical protein